MFLRVSSSPVPFQDPILASTVADESDVGNAPVRSTHSTTANLHPFAPNLSVIQLKLQSYEAAVHAG